MNRPAENSASGQLYVISGPSGVGKSTILEKVLDQDRNLKFSVSSTTRPQRQGEIHGKDYYFLSKSDFIARIRKGCFLEWAEVHGELYGTDGEEVRTSLEKGYDVVLDIDVQGTRQIQCFYPDVWTIFIIPPSLEVLRNRLNVRCTESSDQLSRRLQAAQREIQEAVHYHYIIVNGVLDEAVADCLAIFRACRSHRRNQVQHLKSFFHSKSRTTFI